MSVDAPSTGALSSPLAPLLRHAGAVFSGRHSRGGWDGRGGREGRAAVLHYGSAPGELAVCVSAVGLLDRSDLTKLAIEASPEHLNTLIARLAGGTLATGGTLLAGNAWWCAAGPGTVVVLCEPTLGGRLLPRLEAERRHIAGLRVEDRSDEWASIGVIGRRAAEVLRALGVYGESGDPRRVSPFTSHAIGTIEARWLLESERGALVLVPQSQASQAWRAIEEAGRPFGISYVGLEAARRYALLQRAARRT